MNNFNSFRRKIYEVNDASFEDIALALFRFQAENNRLYAAFLQYLEIRPGDVKSLNDVPFMPISFFKRHAIQTTSWEPRQVFVSSGTTGSIPSRHLVLDPVFYQQHSRRCFEFHFGPLEDYHFLALLPAYLEREGSSLIFMMEYFINESKSPHSGFYLKEINDLVAKLGELRNCDRKVVLWGVTFALLDLAESMSIDLSHCLIFETGGMKGRRKEITREEFHSTLCSRFNVDRVYSEYGMTELMSQAYTHGGVRYQNPPWMRILGRDAGDPMEKGVVGETAGINIVDLGNWHSIAFIETEDLGKVYSDGTFEIIGRMDNSDVRGCNLLI